MKYGKRFLFTLQKKVINNRFYRKQKRICFSNGGHTLRAIFEGEHLPFDRSTNNLVHKTINQLFIIHILLNRSMTTLSIIFSQHLQFPPSHRTDRGWSTRFFAQSPHEKWEGGYRSDNYVMNSTKIDIKTGDCTTFIRHTWEHFRRNDDDDTRNIHQSCSRADNF